MENKTIEEKFSLDKRDVIFAGCYYILYFRVRGIRGKYPVYTKAEAEHLKAYCYQFLGIDKKKCHGDAQIIRFLYDSLKSSQKTTISGQETHTFSYTLAKKIFERHFGIKFGKLRGRKKIAAIAQYILDIRNNILLKQGQEADDPQIVELNVQEDSEMSEATQVTNPTDADIDVQAILGSKTREAFREITGMRFRMTKAMKSQFNGDGNAAFAAYMELIRSDDKERETLLEKIRAKRAKQV